MADIRFHGAIDVIISHNHIYRCGDVAGIWLDWMGQGAQVTGNLLHDNLGGYGDFFFEMQHGPILVANNLMLSKGVSFSLNSQGIAFAHNLIGGSINNHRSDDRSTPFHPAHSTQLAGLCDARKGDSGDHRFYNNLFVSSGKLRALDNSALPCFAAGNVFTKGTQPSKLDTAALLKPEFAADVTLTEKPERVVSRLHPGTRLGHRAKPPARDHGAFGEGGGARRAFWKPRRLSLPSQYRLLRPEALPDQSLPWPLRSDQGRQTVPQSLAALPLVIGAFASPWYSGGAPVSKPAWSGWVGWRELGRMETAPAPAALNLAHRPPVTLPRSLASHE
jgi:hypothetical protein